MIYARQNNSTNNFGGHKMNSGTNAAVFINNIDEETHSNRYYRKVLYTTDRTQVVLMSLKSGVEIGLEIHPADQFIKVESGVATAKIVNIVGSEKIERTFTLFPGYSITIPENTYHNIINHDNALLQLYTIYTPPQHSPGQIEN